MQLTLDSLALRSDLSEIVNVASVSHRSPFRYPGGKTWLVPLVRRWLLARGGTTTFCEPFCGGGSIGLSILFDGLTRDLTMVELDDDVAAVWEVIFNGQAGELAAMISAFDVSVNNVRKVLIAEPRSPADRAFATIVRNRTQRGGIMATGASLMKNGENGRGVASRWYPETLCKRIVELSNRSEQVKFVHGDGMTYMKDHRTDEDTLFFIDPPYTAAGRRLYAHSEIDHDRLFQIVTQLSGDFLMTYDDADQIRTLAERYSFDVVSLPMKNTHHRIMNELLIGKDLAWARS